MILSIFLSLLTAWIIYIWGNAVYLIAPKQHGTLDGFFYKYIIGFCFLTFFANALTIVTGTDTWWVQICLFIPVIFLKRSALYPKFNIFIPQGISLQTSIFALLGFLVMASIHAWEIRHPDTLTYQNQLIGISKLGSHPAGIIKIKDQLGLGGSYFSLAGLFSYPIILNKVITFANLALAGVFVLFLSIKLNNAILKKQTILSIIIIFTLLICFFEYTFLRLSVNSASPDTPAAIIGLSTFLYYLKKNKRGWVLMLLSMTAVTLKLSLAPILLLPIFYLARSFNIYKGITIILVGLIIISPFLFKNIKSTGYLIYPIAISKVKNASYTPERMDVQNVADYIKAYARTTSATRKKEDLENILNMPFREWGLRWWQEMSWPGRIMLFSFLASICLMACLIVINEKKNWEYLTYLAVVIFGFIFWLNFAPAIRFGSAFLLAPLFFLIDSGVLKQLQNKISIPIVLSKLLIIIVCLVLLVYTAYRMIYFMDTSSLLIPKGPVG
jgi:hypothetical protein